MVLHTSVETKLLDYRLDWVYQHFVDRLVELEMPEEVCYLQYTGIADVVDTAVWAIAADTVV
jgi:hypothetical protein